MKSDEEKLITLRIEYEKLAHAMQTGVAAEMNLDPGPTEPKYLRVGINAAMADHSGLVRLLIEKGIFTELEYYTSERDAMKAEVARYEKHLSDKYGSTIKLG